MFRLWYKNSIWLQMYRNWLISSFLAVLTVSVCGKNLDYWTATLTAPDGSLSLTLIGWNVESPKFISRRKNECCIHISWSECNEWSLIQIWFYLVLTNHISLLPNFSHSGTWGYPGFCTCLAIAVSPSCHSVLISLNCSLTKRVTWHFCFLSFPIRLQESKGVLGYSTVVF